MVGLPPWLARLLSVLRPVAGPGYRALIEAAGHYLRRRLPNASAYVAGTGASGELVPGLSDIDLVLVLGGASEAVERDRSVVLDRWRRLRRVLSPLARGLGIAVYSERDLQDETGGTALTFGLAAAEAGADPDRGYLRPGRPSDDLYRRIHPGIYGPGRTWRLVSGTARTTAEPIRAPDYRRLAAWLELQWWWRFSFALCTSRETAFASYLAFKLVAEPIRIWLWLSRGERTLGRRQAIERAIELLPGEEALLRRTLALHDSLPGAGEPPRAETLAWLLRMGSRIAELLERELAQYGTTEVLLLDGDLVLPTDACHRSSPGSLPENPRPLADWRARAMPPLADEALFSVDVDPTAPAGLGALADSAVAGLQPAVRAGPLLLLPNDAFSDRVLLRSVQFGASDPVSFALLDERTTAAFPEVPGWSAIDSARRAVREHRCWLAGWTGEESPSQLALDLLLTAARSALFLESIRAGEPELPLCAATTTARLAERHPASRGTAEEAYSVFREARTAGTVPSARIVDAFRDIVARLPGYAGAA
jgi:hypothetical protein